ncbi:MAG: hypothetical protein R3C28_10540 [Pirellulaceae bacterium]
MTRGDIRRHYFQHLVCENADFCHYNTKGILPCVESSEQFACSFVLLLRQLPTPILLWGIFKSLGLIQSTLTKLPSCQLGAARGTTLYFTDNGFYDSETFVAVRANFRLMFPQVVYRSALLLSPNWTSDYQFLATKFFIGESAFPNSLDAAYPSADLVFGLNFDGTNWVTTATGNDSHFRHRSTPTSGNLNLGERKTRHISARELV